MSLLLPILLFYIIIKTGVSAVFYSRYYILFQSHVPPEYHEFANVFSKTKAKVLAPLYSYNLKINLEEGAQPLVGPIYFLLTSEQEALKEFIEENLNMGFI